MKPLPALKKDFIKILERTNQSRRPFEIFRDWLEIAAIALHQLPYHHDLPKDSTFHQLEEKYLELERHLSPAEREAFAELFGIIVVACRQGFSDFLGEIYHECEFHNERSGQFFTPYHLSKAMARMQLGTARSLIEEKGIITISDPACGAGGMLIAAASELFEQQIDPRSCVQFHAVDIDRVCFNMTYIQLAASDLQAVVIHGNSLSLETWEVRPTPQLRYFGQWLEERKAEHRSAAMLEKLRELMTTPHDTNEEPAPAPESAPVPVATEEAEPMTLAEACEIASTLATKPASGKRKRQRADIVIDQNEWAEQLSLFDVQSENTE